MASFADDRNDIAEMMEKCSNRLNAIDPMWMLRLSFGAVSLDAVKAIVECMDKAVLNIGDGLTLLHLAGQCNRPDWIHYLAGEKQHPLEVRTIHGETPLDQAAWRGNIDAAVALIRYGADVDCQTNLGYSPLHRCAFYNHPRLGSMLCLAGANQLLRDENHQTAYEVAVEKRNNRLINLLTPLFDSEGNNISGCMYASNNPKHPNYRPEAREAFFTLCALDMVASSGNIISGVGEVDDGDCEEEEESEWEDLDDEDDEQDEEDDNQDPSECAE